MFPRTALPPAEGDHKGRPRKNDMMYGRPLLGARLVVAFPPPGTRRFIH
jgi:hypothetical protein